MLVEAAIAQAPRTSLEQYGPLGALATMKWRKHARRLRRIRAAGNRPPHKHVEGDSACSTGQQPVNQTSPELFEPVVSNVSPLEYGQKLHRYWTNACRNCSLKSRCTPGRAKVEQYQQFSQLLPIKNAP